MLGWGFLRRQIFLGKQKKKGTIFMAIKENVEAFAVKQGYKMNLNI